MAFLSLLCIDVNIYIRRRGKPGQESPDRTGITGQAQQDRHNRTCRTGQTGLDRQIGTGRTGHP
jgi:hypothetical protein